MTTLRQPGVPDYGATCISVHAEANALMFCSRTQREGGTLYVTGISCLDCAKLVSNSGIVRVVAINDETAQRPAHVTKQLYARSGLQFDLMPPPFIQLNIDE